ncbi:MAG: zinc-binding alcohol dehydrogenase family protein [Woeseiaceae bacterium]|jgi:NADPH:quinone reductase-like Zn-dependent oxidoreductase
MKAAVIHQFGDFDVLKVEDIATPKPKPGNVLVKILAAGVNRLDHYLREGSVVPDFPFPHILGADAAGEVFRPGKGVTDFEIGDRVIVVPGYPQNEEDYDIYPGSQAPSFGLPGLHIPGTYAQYIEVPARFLLKDETGLTAAEAATLPVALATAVRAVKEVAGVKAGDSVLVQAGASGSGSMQIQVAKALGARVATTIRNASKADIVREIGADLVINTNDDDVVERVKEWTDGRGADVVIDNLAGDVFATSIAAAKATGVIVAFGFAAGPEVKFDIRSLFFEQKEIKGSMASDKRDMEFGLQLVREGRIRPLLDRTLPLSEAAQAHRLVANNEVTGSIALLPWAA